MTSIIVESIRLRNFGAVKEATLRPLKDGLTGISGISGAGKSTFLKGMRFALFNDVPKNIKIANLRRIGSDYKNDECSVSVVFNHGGQKIEVIRELVGKNNTNIPSIYVDGIEQVHSSSSTAEAWVKKRLGMDGKDFTTAMVIPQKQLDELVDDTPAIRRSRIEKLAGIESMSLAVKSAREEENLVKTQVKAMPGSEDAVDHLEDEVRELSDTLEEELYRDKKTETYLETLEADYNVDIVNYENMVTQHKLYTEASDKFHSQENILNNLLGNIDSVKTQLSSATERFNVGTEYNVADLESQLQGYQKEQDSLSATAQAYRVAAVTLEKQIENDSKSLNDKKIQRENVKNAVDALIANSVSIDMTIAGKARDDISEAQDNIAAVTAQKNQLVKEWKETDAGIKLLSVTDSNHHCPTCKMPLPDPSGLISSLQTTLRRIESDGNILNGQVEEWNEKLNSAKNTLVSFEAQLKEKEARSNKIEIEKNVFYEIEFQIRELEARIANSKQNQEDNELFDADGVADKLQRVSEAKNEALRLLEAMKHTAQAEKEKNALEAQLEGLQEKADTLSSNLEIAQEALSALEPVNIDNISDLKQTLTTVRTMIETNRQARNDLAVLISSNTVRLENAKTSLAKETKLFKAKTKLLSELEHKTAVSDVLDEFRKSSIAKIAPELADGATELISSMTNGKFVEIDLDSEFTPSIVNSDGHTLTIHQLSGGELSVVALALRIAIGTLISGGTGGMLWLDEVLSAQDVGRRHAILAAIRALPVNQIVMINHTAEAEDVVDKVVHMVYTGDDGSYIDEESSTDDIDSIDSNVSDGYSASDSDVSIVSGDSVISDTDTADVEVESNDNAKSDIPDNVPF